MPGLRLSERCVPTRGEDKMTQRAQGVHPARFAVRAPWWRRGGANGQRTTKRAGSHKSRRRPLDPVFGVDSENRGLGGPFTDPGRALTESSVSRAPNLNLPARGHTPWLYKPDFRNQRRKWVLGAEREEFSTQYPLGPIGAEGEKKLTLYQKQRNGRSLTLGADSASRQVSNYVVASVANRSQSRSLGRIAT